MSVARICMKIKQILAFIFYDNLSLNTRLKKIQFIVLLLFLSVKKNNKSNLFLFSFFQSERTIVLFCLSIISWVKAMHIVPFLCLICCLTQNIFFKQRKWKFWCTKIFVCKIKPTQSISAMLADSLKFLSVKTKILLWAKWYNNQIIGYMM